MVPDTSPEVIAQRRMVADIFARIRMRHPTMRIPPTEVQLQIADYLESPIESSVITTITKMHPPQGWTPLSRFLPSMSPASGASPVMGLPNELRRKIFAESLPKRDALFYPSCKDDRQARFSSRFSPDAEPRRNQASDLMTLNHTIRDEILEVLMEERFFVIHVHEGLRHGGIEFLDAGRQPLQYQDCIEDARFHKFGKNDLYGFQRAKKIRIQICQPLEEECRHTAINTHFMIKALCRLLERTGEGEAKGKTRITNLSVAFLKQKNEHSQSGRPAIQLFEHYWWDPEKQKPRETSIHNLSNIELVLRPLAMLTNCHKVTIDLPPNVRYDPHLKHFASELSNSMTGKSSGLFIDDDLEMKIESARYAMEDYVNYTLHGKGYHSVEKMTDAEMLAASDDESDEFDGPRGKKHDLSPFSKAKGGDRKRLTGMRSRRTWSEGSSDDEGVVFLDDKATLESANDDIGSRALRESRQTAFEEEEKAVQAAIAASLRPASQAEDPPNSYQRVPRRLPNSQLQTYRPNSYGSTSQAATSASDSAFRGMGRTLAGNSGFQELPSSNNVLNRARRLSALLAQRPSGTIDLTRDSDHEDDEEPVTSVPRFGDITPADYTTDAVSTNGVSIPSIMARPQRSGLSSPIRHKLAVQGSQVDAVDLTEP